MLTEDNQTVRLFYSKYCVCVCVCVCCGGSAENYNMDYNHGEPHVSPYTAREGENFHRGGKKLGGLQERKSLGFY